MSKIDLNSDIGESFGNYNLGMDQEVSKYITSANIACGWHAGDPLVMEQTVKIAKENNVGIGAHPGFKDLMGFGRRKMDVSAQEVKAYIKYQLGALMAFAKSNNLKVSHLKPHGAMYNQAASDYEIAEAIAEAIYEVDQDIILMGLSGSQLIKAGKDKGVKVANEVFADRAYTPKGRLVSRKREGAVIHDPQKSVERMTQLIKKGYIEAINGEKIELAADSICVHGDNPEALAQVEQLKEGLISAGVEITPLTKVIN